MDRKINVAITRVLMANATNANSWIAGLALLRDNAKITSNAVAAAIEAMAKPPRLLAMVGLSISKYFLEPIGGSRIRQGR